jgi:hypothetical protein
MMTGAAAGDPGRSSRGAEATDGRPGKREGAGRPTYLAPGPCPAGLRVIIALCHATPGRR